ncbi:unnamed protein product [Bursaphelenchus okinawaensis]|uniref:Uncharacterized protein n=1 Tax=Bursaphelenchus okinawaensis TaxID=465554 RepID=A0A811JQI7_9BILA|nr:unnamed protein product [Bursaphelenchus okinawaensis]CAG9078095.1 unnamed protein product [Bursaphelenchus okinawaensis]
MSKQKNQPMMKVSFKVDVTTNGSHNGLLITTGIQNGTTSKIQSFGFAGAPRIEEIQSLAGSTMSLPNAITARPQSSSVGDVSYEQNERSNSRSYVKSTTPTQLSTSVNVIDDLTSRDFKLNTFEKPQEYVLKDTNTTTTTVEVFRATNEDNTDFYQLPPQPKDEQQRFTYVPARGPPYERFETAETKFPSRAGRSVSPGKTVQWNENPEIFEMNSNYSDRTEKTIREEEKITRTISPSVPYTVTSPTPTTSTQVEIHRTSSKYDSTATITPPKVYTEVSTSNVQPLYPIENSGIGLSHTEPKTELDEDGYATLNRGSQTNLSDLYAPILHYADPEDQAAHSSRIKSENPYVTPRISRPRYPQNRSQNAQNQSQYPQNRPVSSEYRPSSRNVPIQYQGRPSDQTINTNYGSSRPYDGGDWRGYTTQPNNSNLVSRGTNPIQHPSELKYSPSYLKHNLQPLNQPLLQPTPSQKLDQQQYKPSQRPNQQQHTTSRQFDQRISQRPDLQQYTPSQHQPRSLHRTKRAFSASPDYIIPSNQHRRVDNQQEIPHERQSRRRRNEKQEVLREWERELSRSPSPWRPYTPEKVPDRYRSLSREPYRLYETRDCLGRVVGQL